MLYTPHPMAHLKRLATLLQRRNEVDQEIAEIIGRPAEKGHIGEYIASQIFQIELEESASKKSVDGRFVGGPLKGRTVNIKWYTRMDGLLDINPNALPDYYLVMTGAPSPPTTSRGQVRPLLIERVFLFDACTLVNMLKSRGVKIGIATSVPGYLWKQAEIYPSSNGLLSLSQEQREALQLFGTSRSGPTH